MVDSSLNKVFFEFDEIKKQEILLLRKIKAFNKSCGMFDFLINRHYTYMAKLNELERIYFLFRLFIIYSEQVNINKQILNVKERRKQIYKEIKFFLMLFNINIKEDDIEIVIKKFHTKYL
jgi:hypothetical protein